MLLGRVAVVLLVFGAAVAAAELAPPERSYNFLMLLPVSSKSHRNVFMPLATALTQRGHKVTMLSNHPPADNNPSITYIEHGLPYLREEELDIFEIIKQPKSMFGVLEAALPFIAREIYKVPAIKELYLRRKQFDLIILDNVFNEFMLPFAHNQSFITIATVGVDPMHSAVSGNVLNPSYVSNLMVDYPLPMSFLNRFKNLFITIFFPIMWHHMLINNIQHEISKQFPDLPPLMEMAHNQSLELMNSHFSQTFPLPLLPSQIEVGGMHCSPGQPLPKDLLEFVDTAVPVVYFSLGSVARSSTMPLHYRTLLLTAFGKLPYKFIWKFEDQLENLPANVIIQKWMPQQDILAHPNVKLFITHGGRLSGQEALYHAKPLLVLPLFGDQPRNAEQFKNYGFGLTLNWEQLTERLVMDTITELITNPSYKNKVSEVAVTFKDQLQRPVDKAVFWTEYVVRHHGATHMRSPQTHLTWIQFLNLDIIAAVLLLLYVLWRLVKKCYTVCVWAVSSAKPTK